MRTYGNFKDEVKDKVMTCLERTRRSFFPSLENKRQWMECGSSIRHAQKELEAIHIIELFPEDNENYNCQVCLMSSKI